jgi:hypothetical protein
MRRVLAVGCCALYLSFGFVAGLAHVHESADHHDEPRGLHLDHGHLGESADQRRHHEHTHDHAHGGDRPARTTARHADHHDGDAVYLSAAAARVLDSSVRPMPASVYVGTVTDPPLPVSKRNDVVTARPRDRPTKTPPRLRAPPA